jgi:catechol-2,3-dioxygenase
MADGSARGLPTQLGHVALRVRNLDRAIAFYRDVLGLNLYHRRESGAFLGIRPDASHEVALFELPEDAPGPEQNRVGMYHMAWEMPSFADLEALHERLVTHDARIVGYSPHSANVMFLDPDGNEQEAVWEPSKEEREQFTVDGKVSLPRLKQVIP